MNGRIENENLMIKDIVSFYGFDLTDEKIKENIVNAEQTRINAVYFLWLNRDIVYVGCTSVHPLERVKAHKGRANFDEISWIEVPKPLMRAVEWFYIDKLNPPENRNRYKPWLGSQVAEFTGIHIKRLNYGDNR